MSNLTDADQDAFADYMQGTLISNKALLIAGDGKGSGWDPTSCATRLETAGTEVITAAGDEAEKAQALSTATQTKQSLRGDRYELASGGVSSAEGALGKKHPLVREMRKKRKSFSHASPKAKAKSTTS